MRTVLIRNHVNKHLFWDGDGWTEDPGLACKFPTTLDGIAFALQHEINGAEIVVHLDTQAEPITVPLN